MVATTPLLEGIGGRYFEDCNEAAVLNGTGTEATDAVDYMPLHNAGVAAYALDPENASRLWKVSLTMLGRQ